MEAIRRVDFYFCIGYRYFLGNMGLRLAFMIVTPLFILWFMSWDEKRYTRTRKQQQARYVYRKFP